MSKPLKSILELDFISRIDENFPYGDRRECIKLIDEAIGISPNAVFAVIEEIARIPDDEKEKVPFLALTDILKVIDVKFDHPVQAAALKTARNMLAQEETPLAEVLTNIASLKEYPRLYAALNIFYYSSFDESGSLDKAWDEVIKVWDAAIV